MPKPPLFLGIFPLTLLLGAYGLGAAACGSGSAINDCFDYKTFKPSTTTVSFSTQVLPIFRTSCALSTSCHGCDTSTNPDCTKSGISPFLGIPNGPGPTPVPMTTAQLQAIFTQAVGQPAALQSSTVTAGGMVGDPDMMIIAAGDPQHSFMMYKLDGDPKAADLASEVTCATLTCAPGKTCGLAMPSGGPRLSDDELTTLRTWIAQGATNN
jgi:hypothetical protein